MQLKSDIKTSCQVGRKAIAQSRSYAPQRITAAGFFTGAMIIPIAGVHKKQPNPFVANLGATYATAPEVARLRTHLEVKADCVIYIDLSFIVAAYSVISDKAKLFTWKEIPVGVQPGNFGQ